jgi:hypothetical protein
MSIKMAFAVIGVLIFFTLIASIVLKLFGVLNIINLGCIVVCMCIITIENIASVKIAQWINN